MSTKVFKIEAMFIDHDNLGVLGVQEVIENARLPNHIIPPRIVKMDAREVEWDDDHPLNHNGWRQAFNDLFKDREGMVFEVRDDRLVVDGIEFVIPEEQRKDPLVSIVLMRLSRMYNIVRMWEGE